MGVDVDGSECFTSVCPLRVLSSRDEFSYCDGSKCAWWDGDGGRCCLLTIAVALSKIEPKVERPYRPWLGGPP